MNAHVSPAMILDVVFVICAVAALCAAWPSSPNPNRLAKWQMFWLAALVAVVGIRVFGFA